MGYAALWPRNQYYPISSWHADHIVPVSEGGGACDLSNLRTLCWRCHRAETTALRRRLYRRREALLEEALNVAAQQQQQHEIAAAEGAAKGMK